MIALRFAPDLAQDTAWANQLSKLLVLQVHSDAF
jgi:hypothetical protein